LKYAASKGFAIVVMEPIGGGRLATNPPEQIQKIWEEEGGERSPAEWALQWVWNHPEVSVVLSGMSSMSQVVENVESASRSAPNSLNQGELQFIDRIRQEFLRVGFIGCTNCQYCIPCPEGVDIPKIITFYNKYFAQGRDSQVKKEYRKQTSKESRAKKCAKCGKCEELCPQQLPIRKILSGATWIFAE
jgi:predicted aldo/keto reductase-like oxidoreductase